MGCSGSKTRGSFRRRSSRLSSIDTDRSDPVQLVFVTDPGQDLDDEMAFVMTRHLVEMNLARVTGVVATLAPAFDRARLIRGTCDVLGLLGVPVGYGSDGGDIAMKHKAETFTEWAKPYMAPRYSAASDSFKPGRQLLRTLYKDAEAKSLTFIVIASLKDAAIFLRDSEELFIEKTKEVVIMGGVQPWAEKDGVPTVLEPDTANNNTFDFEAAKFFYLRCQEIGIPLIVVTRWSAYASKLPASCYNELAATGSWIGCRLRNAQRQSIETLWSRAASPSGSELRGGLPDRCNKDWFMKTFCGGHSGSDRGAKDTIWDLVQGFMQYDTMAVLAAIPSLRDELFRPERLEGLHGAEHMVIGKTEKEHNIKSPKGLVEYLYKGFKAGMAYNHRRKVQTILLLQPRWHNHAETLVSCLVLRAICELDIMDCAGIILQPVPGESLNDPLERLCEDVVKTLCQVGLPHVPVRVANPKETTGTEHLFQLYQKVSPAGITLVIAASLDVAADFAAKYPSVFVQKTQKVIVVGGGKLVPGPAEEGKPIEMIMEPDGRAQNFVSDMPAAKRFFKAVQNLLVPIVTVSREFAQVVHIPRSFYDALGDAQAGGHVGKYLYNVQRSSTAEFWKAVCSQDPVQRKHLPASLDRKWFINTFCSGTHPASDKDGDVWNCLKYFNVYNAQAILLALPPVFNRFVLGTTIKVRDVTHTIVGSSVDDPGIVEPNEFQRLILQCMVTGTRLSSSAFDLEVPEPVQLDNDDSTWTYDTRNNALDWLLPLEHRKPNADEDAEQERFTRSLCMESMGTMADLWRSEPHFHKEAASVHFQPAEEISV